MSGDPLPSELLNEYRQAALTSRDQVHAMEALTDAVAELEAEVRGLRERRAVADCIRAGGEVLIRVIATTPGKVFAVGMGAAGAMWAARAAGIDTEAFVRLVGLFLGQGGPPT